MKMALVMSLRQTYSNIILDPIERRSSGNSASCVALDRRSIVPYTLVPR